MTGEDCALAFEMAQRETTRAWHGTSMLARVDTSKYEQISEIWLAADPVEISRYLTDVAGRAFDGYALKTGIDPLKLTKMGVILMRQLATCVESASSPESVLVSLNRLSEAVKAWIRGTTPEGCAGLEKISHLLGPDAPLRLALLAPYAPAIASVEIVVRARIAVYPFREAPPQ